MISKPASLNHLGKKTTTNKLALISTNCRKEKEPDKCYWKCSVFGVGGGVVFSLRVVDNTYKAYDD